MDQTKVENHGKDSRFLFDGKKMHELRNICPKTAAKETKRDPDEFRIRKLFFFFFHVFPALKLPHFLDEGRGRPIGQRGKALRGSVN